MKIKKAATARHESTLSPFIRKSIAEATAAPIDDLVGCLNKFPKDWPFPRGDLYHWIPLLDRFDTILEEQVTKYKLKDGPQTIPLEPADKLLLLTIMDFTRLLVEKCGNRSLYASSGLIGELLNCTDLDIIYSALYLSSRLALRYYSSRSRGTSSSNQAALLASHYNINLDKVQKLASPFVKGIGVTSTTTPATPGGKSSTTKAILPVFLHDLGRIARGEDPPNTSPGGSKGKAKSADSKDGSWDEWGGAWISYYMNPKSQSSPPTSVMVSPLPVREPTTPTPRRISTHHHLSNVTPSPSSHRSRNAPEETPHEAPPPAQSTGLQTLEIEASRVRDTKNLEEIISSSLHDVPTECHYEFLHRLRVARALGGDLETRRKILGIRLLALTNLAYVYSENQFQAKILSADTDEPRRLQLAFQLAELLQTKEATGKDSEVPRWVQTLAIGALEAFGRHKARLVDISNALSLNVNHGVLLYVMRKLLAELSTEEGDDGLEAEEWRESLFSLVTILPTFFHIGTSLVSAGLIQLLIDMIKLRTERALRHLPKAINVLDQLIYGIPNAFQSLASGQGLEAVVELVAHEIKAGLEEVAQGKGITAEFRSPQTHYQISHHRQQTLKMVTKFMQHIMSQSGANVDRLLRNLIDSPKLLESIRIVIGGSDIWGSNIWSTVVHMISSFIHNEPTSYAVIHEAHITHALLEAVTGKTGLVEEEARKKKEDEERRLKEEKAAKEKAATEEAAGASDEPKPEEPPATTTPAEKPTEKEPEFTYVPSGKPAAGIMASGEAIGIIPTAFDAICLNPAGLALIQSSGAIYSYFEIFESPVHAKILAEGDLDNVLGNQFDELVRHHPVLRETVVKATLRMLDNVSVLGHKYASEHGIGAKIWLEDGSGGLVVSGGRNAIIGKTLEESKAVDAAESKGKGVDTDVEMGEAGPSESTGTSVVQTASDGAPVNQVVTLADVYDDEDEAKKGDLIPLTDFIDVAARFLEGLIQNPGQIRDFLQHDGLKKLLAIHHLPGLPYDFATSQANQTLCRTVQMCAEHSLVNTLKSVFTSAQKAIEPLEPFLQHVKKEPFFAPLTTPSKKNVTVLPPRLQAGVPPGDEEDVAMVGSDTFVDNTEAEAEKQAVENLKANGTTLIKDLVTMHCTSYLLQDLFNQHLFTVRQHVQVFLSSTQDLDKEGFILKLGLLQRQCVWEEILLQNGIPSTWDAATRSKDSANPTAAIDGATLPSSTVAEGTSGETAKTDEKETENKEAVVEKDGKTSWFRNVKTIRFLIGQIPTTINPFMHGIAKSIITRRTSDMQVKYSALKLIDSVCDSMYTHLTWERLGNLSLDSPPGQPLISAIETSTSVTERYGYWIIMLSSLMSLLLDGMTPDVFSTPKSTPQDRPLSAITSTVVTFKQKGGLDVVKKILCTFWDELQTLPPAADAANIDQSDGQRMAHSYGGIKVILSIFSHLVSSKAVIESNQSQALHVRSTTDSERTDYFNVHQLLVELRATILPVVKDMWEASSMEKASSSMVKSVVEILGTVLKAENEAGAFTAKDVERRPNIKNFLSWKNMIPREEQVRKLVDMGFQAEPARQALIRFSDVLDDAANYLSTQSDRTSRYESNEMDEDDDDEDEHDDEEDDEDDDNTDVDGAEDAPTSSTPPPPAPEAPSDAPESAQTVAASSMPPPPPLVSSETGSTPSASAPQSEASVRVRIEDLVAPTPSRDESTVQVAGEPPVSAAPTDSKGKSKESDTPEQPRFTIEDLEGLRQTVRETLINRCLDVIQAHDDTVFELADLIRSSFAKSAVDIRKEVVSTIIQSLLSLQMEDDFRPQGKTIAATAHLLGLIIQDNAFYEAATEDLKEHFSYLVAFLKIYPGDPAPWVPKILLIVEKLLSENAQPDKLKFTLGQTEKVVENSSIKIEQEDQESLFRAVLSIIPQIQKDDVIPLAVARVLLLLTRRRELAIKMTEDGNLQKVFHMYRRQAGTRVDRLQASLMLLLRHVIEDEETTKAIMRAEIRQQFANRSTRNLDTRAFAKSSAHIILRNPDAFVDVVNELCKLQRYDPGLPTHVLLLKEEEAKKEEARKRLEATAQKTTEEQPDEKVPTGESSEEKPAKPEATKETAEEVKEGEAEEKPKTVELRAPGVENPDGVIHFLLTELFAIKDVRDVAPATKPEETLAGEPSENPTEANAATASEANANAPTKSAEKSKPEFKVEHHQFFFYRAFLLMSLAELVCCYNRCKIEFINYNRKANARDPITPSKPRSAIFNYLLNDIIAQQTLNPTDDVDKKKKMTLAEWSQGVFVSLCTHTGESGDSEEEPDLTFVRKFVCETSLKAFKDACASNEILDTKYARMMSLSETFYRILSGVSQSAAGYSAASDKSQFQLAKIMLEKNYISALTTALADVDLNFPEASKKVIKYMLKTLKLLSKVAVDLSENSSLAAPGTTEDDDIMTASSISDVDDMREETPDLYRNSTLGLFEGNEMGDDDEGSYDEDDDDEEMYDDEMGFEEELEEDGESDISDDDDDVEDDGTVEVIVEGAEDDLDSDDDDDEDDSSDDDMEEGDEIDMDGHHHHHHHHHHHDVDEYDTDPENDWHSASSGDEEDHDDLLSGSPLETIARVLGVGDDPNDPLGDDREDGFIDDEGDEEDDMEDDEEDDDIDDEEAMLQEQYDDEDDDDEGGSGVRWGWGGEGDDVPTLRAHPRGAGGWFTLTGSPRDAPPFISRHGGRPRHFIGGPEGGRPRGNQNQNPLLQQSEPEPPRRNGQHFLGNELMNDWVQAMDMSHAGGGPVSMITSLMSFMNRGGGLPPSGAIQFQANIPHPSNFPQSMSRDLRSMFGSLSRMPGESHRSRNDLETSLGALDACATNVRWTQEAEILFGNRTDENAMRIINTLLYYLVPPAVEEEKVRQEKEEAERVEAARLAEEKKAKEEEERVAKEKAEAEEKARKEAEEREAAEKARAETEANATETTGDNAEGASTESRAAVAPMEGVESTTESATAQPEAGPSEPPQERAVVTIRGQEMDITGMGIDPEFLEAIPEDMREEALTHHIRERRAAAVENNQPSEISREFLDALPDEIREELIAQENADRRRREQETARGGAQGGAMDMDLASFLATLEPGLRQTVLLEQDDDSLAQLPHAIVEEVNALRGDHAFNHPFGDLPRARGAAHAALHGRRGEEPKSLKKPARKGTIQLLDKAGVATLLRLMFIPQQNSTKAVLHEILHNICENRQNRAEVLNLLLSILQYGSADMLSVEKSFNELSQRAKAPALQKTPVKPSLHRTNTGNSGNTSNTGNIVVAQSGGEISPLTVAHQCINALLFLVNYNEHIPSYFLNEHDTSTGMKRSLSRKGKGKAVETKSGKYALNTLLALLDRPLITESVSVMEQLAVLLAEITRPLTILLKKDKKKAIEDKPKDDAATEQPSGEAAASSTDAPAPATSTETATQQPGEPSADAAPATSSAAAEKPAEADSKEQAEEPKKPRALVPPVVPEHNLRLVVNILTARECTSKTFRDTLATMQNLSGIPGAKDIFGVELIRQAQILGDVLLKDLDGLLEQINKAQNGTDLQGMALANFSPSGSEQAKLLRVLTALDYLFDPKHNKNKVDDKPEGKGKEKEGTEVTPKAEPTVDVLAQLHDSTVFTPLWDKLSECLTAIHEREDLLHIATVLLPSIEALMVICKHAGLEEKDTKATHPVPEAHTGMRKLFFGFTEDHRKILNQMVRNNPKLMSGSFSLLVNNPKVLDFDNKRNYFSRKLHTRQGSTREPHGTLQLNVRRDQVFMDSYKSMYYKSGDEIKFAKLSIRFSGEEGVDAGGVTREWFQVMARQMFNPGYALFIPVASDRTTFHPNRLSGVNSEHLHFFKFIGRIIGKALYEGRVLDCHFSRAVYKMILGKSVSLKDMETLDLEYYKSLLWMLENDITDIITETFSVDIDEFGAKRTIDLCENGHNVPVTEENKHEYVRLMTEHRLLHSVKEQIDHFLLGFFDIVPAELISIFNEQELELLISGMPEIDMDDWKANTEYHNYTLSSPQIQWFWRAVRSFDKEERAKLLQFVTGTSKVPLNGFKELEGMNGFSKFNIHRDYGNKDRLPSSHTCFNQLDLPEYDSYEALRQQMLTAITQGAEYFGFA